jgi:hypothetical protein
VQLPGMSPKDVREQIARIASTVVGPVKEELARAGIGRPGN